jgi:FAD/FMN-containing dehydrogenase
MQTVSDAGVQDLSTRFSGQLIRPGDPDYDDARTIFNRMIDRRPALVARARSAQDVSEAIRFATTGGYGVAVRGGGHAVAGFAVVDGAVLIDLSFMKDVKVDADAMTITAGGGCRWRDVDPVAFDRGVATPGGTVSATGIAGFTLGGGLGFLSKQHGLACDNLIDAEVVLANGDIVRANQNENPDLFWAIRGGGGNFGVVTSFTYRAYPIGDVTFSASLWPASEFVRVMQFYRDYIPTTPPQSLAIGAYMSAPPMPFVPPDMVGSDAVLVGFVYFGSPEEAQPYLQPILAQSPPVHAAIPMPYPAVQTALDEAAPEGMQNYWRSSFMPSAPDEAIQVMAAAGPGKGSPLTMIQLLNVGPMPEADNAFPNREYPFLYHVISAWPDPSENERQIEWSRQLSLDLAPWSVDGAYLNFTTETDPDRIRRAYGSKFDKLVEIKRRYDPDNVFRNNQNIAP